MADGDPLPAEHHVARCCGPRGIDNGIVTGAAFETRQRDEGKLSVDWIECGNVSPEFRNIEGSKSRLKKSRLRPQSVAILNVGEVRGIYQDYRQLDVIEAHAHTENKCHSVIIGMQSSPEDFETQNQLADLVNNGGQIEWLD